MGIAELRLPVPCPLPHPGADGVCVWGGFVRAFYRELPSIS